VADDPHRLPEEAAQRLLQKIRSFVSDELDDDEATLFAALVAPGVSLAYPSDEGFDSDNEVSGFAAIWRPSALPQALARALVEDRIRIEGL
jgi:hypothetical protein